MTARRIVVHDPCPHGTHRGPHFMDPEETVESLCKGGPHRVLEPGRYVLIERDENGEWPKWVQSLTALPGDDGVITAGPILDALAQEPT